MDEFLCKLATPSEMERAWDVDLRRGPGDPDWLMWRTEAVERARSGQSLPYCAILNGEVIAVATAILDADAVAHGMGIVDNRTAYLSAFRASKELCGDDRFEALIDYALADLKSRGYARVTASAEPGEVKKLSRLFARGFSEFVKTNVELFPRGGQIVALYYAKRL